MRTLRTLNAALGLAVLAGALTQSRPDVFAILMPAGALLFVLGAGSMAGDAIPLRRAALACSAATAALGLAIALRTSPAELLGALVVLLQVVAWRTTGRARRADPGAADAVSAVGAAAEAAPQRARVQ